MPFVVPENPAEGTGLLPERLLHVLTLARAEQVPDPVDGSVSTQWESFQILGRIGRGSAGEATEDGRQGAVSTAKLLTNTAEVRSADRIIDSDSAATSFVWEVAGAPVPVWNADRVHHWEAPLRRVDG
jgi:hypothetical protein